MVYNVMYVNVIDPHKRNNEMGYINFTLDSISMINHTLPSAIRAIISTLNYVYKYSQ